ncbi:outer membrane protein assembly factor BamA [Thiovibrio frasassiensis]|jgi:outer membrane protein insertion porin family|uniref:Outer membrane protein assembly factor BamA n=1 Tax=Thiovibrio frasassiensis TaxID=2984131 RepID=A0A9X4MHA6_9BACT|nr:outer membrane protein assembly factor BamA [Thiovibrio frasassiensis]MDG4476373.1 outer membrane protein assembly factor BamA [Thiovibrio frasassiensis]
MKIVVLALALFVSLGFLPLAGAAVAAGLEPNTVMIPPRINAQAGVEQLLALSDKTLKEVVQSKGLAMLSREEVQAKLGYEHWPPKVEAVKPLIASPAVNYVAVGSITKLGEQLSLDYVVYDIFGNNPPKFYYQVSNNEAELQKSFNQMVNDILSHTGQYFLVQSIAIAGNTRVDSGAILRQVKSQAGDRYAPELLRADLKNIFQMGYFDDVQILVTDTEKGKEITFQVTEKAVIGQVLVNGENELEEKEVKEVVSVSPNTIINTKEVQTSVENIRKLYKDKGFYRTNVAAKLNYVADDKVNVTFDIEEGVKMYIKGIRFVGNKAFTEKELRKEMTTSEKGLLSWFTESGKLKRDLLEQDRSRIGAMYHNSGYIEAKISEPEISDEGDWLYVTFDIQEGDRYRVGTIEIEGDIVGEKNDLFSLLELSKEKFFSRKILREDVLRLTDRYAESGYAFAEVDPKLSKNEEDKRMDLSLKVAQGTLVHINRINIKGNTRTRDKVIRREMQVKEGGLLDASAVRKSSERLQRLEFFEEVNVTPEPTVQEDLMDVVVEVKEKATGTFSVGAGYSSVDNMMFMGEVSEKNFLGKGQHLSLQANVSSRSSRYNFSFTEPHLNDTKLLFGYDIYNWSREYDDYTKDSTGGALRFGYPIWNKWMLGWAYGYDDTKMTDVLLDNVSQSILDSLDIETTSFFRIGVSKDTRNKFTDASTGWLTSYSIKQAGGPLGGDSAFTKYEATSGWYYPLWWDTTFHVKGSIGYVTENEDKKLPVFEKFYLGGLNTIRGFDSGKISPLELNPDGTTYSKVGGEKMWYGNVEYIFPLVSEIGLKGLVFFDLGNVYTDSDTWDVADLRYSTGVGFRWLSPMGPLRLEWGYNLDPKEGEKQGVWDFSIGGAF